MSHAGGGATGAGVAAVAVWAVPALAALVVSATGGGVAFAEGLAGVACDEAGTVG